MIDYTQTREYLHWAEKRLGVDFSSTPAIWLTALNQRSTILGVVVFSRFTVGNCEVTVVLRDTFFPKGLFLAALGYVFTQLNLGRVTAFIAVDNERSLKSAQRLGFRIEGRLRQWFPSGDAFILGLLRDDFFHKDSHGQPLSPASTRSDCGSPSAG